ncbi:hypothetical protein HPP92_008449 [Vanilla planifolia]|uniref:C3H1-type domain-containing protein n=1 Tax=Vanilla planifolia TaxID=51239 RepID=A0A835V3S1_VANPL|nr:hypothetical protein HPP92_008449 [Vanilla planifolia]
MEQQSGLELPFGRFPEEVAWYHPQMPPGNLHPVDNRMYNLQRRTQTTYFKTSMCYRFTSGCCPKGVHCNFAHSMEELRRPFGNGDRRTCLPVDDCSGRIERTHERCGLSEEQKMHKNKICRNFYNGEVCPYGDRCSFAHVKPGSLKDSSASNQNSVYWKTKLCHKWSNSGYCPHGDHCSYAHGEAELRMPRGDYVGVDGKGIASASSIDSPNRVDDAFTTKTKFSPAATFQAKIRGLTLNKSKRIYGDWIDD